MTAAGWAPAREGYHRWLAPDNFDASGVQLSALAVPPAAATDGYC